MCFYVKKTKNVVELIIERGVKMNNNYTFKLVNVSTNNGKSKKGTKIVWGIIVVLYTLLFIIKSAMGDFTLYGLVLGIFLWSCFLGFITKGKKVIQEDKTVTFNITNDQISYNICGNDSKGAYSSTTRILYNNISSIEYYTSTKTLTIIAKAKTTLTYNNNPNPIINDYENDVNYSNLSFPLVMDSYDMLENIKNISGVNYIIK